MYKYSYIAIYIIGASLSELHHIRSTEKSVLLLDMSFLIWHESHLSANYNYIKQVNGPLSVKQYNISANHKVLTTTYK